MKLQDLNQLYYLRREIEMDTRRLQKLKPALEASPQATRATMADIYHVIEDKRQRCIAERDRMEQYISEIEDDFTKQIFVYRFVHGLSWVQAVERLGGWSTPDSLRMIAARYIQKTNRALKPARKGKQ